jgi:hypothetical protein
MLPAGVSAIHAQAANSPVEAVTVLVKPFHDPAAGEQPCNALTGRLAECPITEQLRERLQNPIPNVETGNLLSRSQNPPRSVTVSLVDIVDDTARVNTRWDFPPQPYNLEFVVKNVNGTWLVADTFCEGNPHTSIFRTPLGPCSLESAQAAEAAAQPGATPGMPNTGEADYPGASLLALLGGLALAGGLGLRAVTSRRTH